MKCSIDDLEGMVQKLPYYKSVWEDEATDKHIHKAYDLRSKIEHLKLVSGIREYERDLAKVDTLLRFYTSPKPEGMTPEDDFLENIKSEVKWLRTRREYLLEEIKLRKKQYFVEIED